MLNTVVKLSWVLLLSLTFFTSCQKEDESTEAAVVETFVEEAVFRMEASGNLGKFGCFELVFPITIEFEDETSLEVNDYDELKAAIKAWKENNPDAEERPTFAFPIEVLSEEGELSTINDKDELRALKKSCKNGQFNGHSGNCGQQLCFDIVFPLNIAFPDDTTAEVNDRSELKQAVRAWKEANPDAIEKPSLVFPIDVVMDDETTVTLNSLDELIALKESCE